jgi:hypothetical protein
VDEDVQVLDGTPTAGKERPARRRRWPLVVGAVVVSLALAALAWATFVGWDTTATATATPPLPWCRNSLRADGVVLTVPAVRNPNGGWFYSGFPAGDTVRIHHQLFHGSRYTFVAADGTLIATTHGRFGGVACHESG